MTIQIDKSREIPATVERVWDIVSDTDKDEQYWGAIRDIKVLRREGNTIEREATVGPRAFAQRSLQTLVLDPKKSIGLKMTGDGMTGERTLILIPIGGDRTRVDVSWKLDVKGVPGFVQNIVKGQISKATEDALQNIASAAGEAEG